jgi:hypothetical protein
MKLTYKGENEFHCHDRETGKYYRFFPGDIIDATETLAALLKGYAKFEETTPEEQAAFDKKKKEDDAKEAEAVKKAQAEKKAREAKVGNEASTGAKDKKGKKK